LVAGALKNSLNARLNRRPVFAGSALRLRHHFQTMLAAAGRY
jgi:hypothetical protein